MLGIMLYTAFRFSEGNRSTIIRSINIVPKYKIVLEDTMTLMKMLNHPVMLNDPLVGIVNSRKINIGKFIIKPSAIK